MKIFHDMSGEKLGLPWKIDTEKDHIERNALLGDLSENAVTLRHSFTELFSALS